MKKTKIIIAILAVASLFLGQCQCGRFAGDSPSGFGGSYYGSYNNWESVELIDSWTNGDITWTFAEDGTLKIREGENETTAYWNITDNQKIDIAYNDRVVSYFVEQPEKNQLLFNTEQETLTLNRK